MILTEPTQFSTPVKPIKHVIAFSHNTPQRPHKDSSTQNLTENLMMGSTCLWSDVLKKFIQKTSKNPEKFMKIQENSKKFSIFLYFSMCSFIIIRSKMISKHSKKLRKIPGIQPIYGDYFLLLWHAQV